MADLARVQKLEARIADLQEKKAVFLSKADEMDRKIALVQAMKAEAEK